MKSLANNNKITKEKNHIQSEGASALEPRSLWHPSPCSYAPRNTSITFPHLASQSHLTAVLKTEYELLAVCILFCKLRYNFQTVNQGVVWWIVTGVSPVQPGSRCGTLSVAWKVPGFLSQPVTGPSPPLKWPCFWVPFKDWSCLFLNFMWMES